MVATLTQSQAELPRLVELASQGEDVLITVGGQPKARLTRAEHLLDNGGAGGCVVDVAAWANELEKLRCQYATRKTGPTVEQILDEDRTDRV